MKKKITLCMVLSTFIICAMLCLTNCSNDDAPTSVFTPEALKQTTWHPFFSLPTNQKAFIQGRTKKTDICGTQILLIK